MMKASVLRSCVGCLIALMFACFLPKMAQAAGVEPQPGIASQLAAAKASTSIPTQKVAFKIPAGGTGAMPKSYAAFDMHTMLACKDGLSIDDDGTVHLSQDAVVGKAYTATVEVGSWDPMGSLQTARRFKVTVRALPPAASLEWAPYWDERNCLSVAWAALPKSQCSGFQVQASPGKSFKSWKTGVAKASATSKAIAGLNLTSRYYVRVRAFKKVGTTTLYGPWSTALRSNAWAAQLDGCCEGPGSLAVYWKSVAKGQCAGFQVQVSTSDSFKARKAVKVKAGASAHTFSGLKAGKRYYMRVRAYSRSSGKTSYGAWSAVAQSNEVEERTQTSLNGRAFMKKAYDRIAKTGKRYGWTVGRLMRSEGYVMTPGSTASVALYSVECTNDTYRYQVNFSGATERVFWAYLYDNKGNTVKEYHDAMALPGHEEAMVADLGKGVLADLKTYSVKRKVAHLSSETVWLAGGDKVVLSMLNTKKRVKWDFVNTETLARESHDQYRASIAKAMKLKVLSKTSVRFSLIASALPYDLFHTSYYLRATVGGKRYYVMIEYPR